jgi:hypothetical protein
VAVVETDSAWEQPVKNIFSVDNFDLNAINSTFELNLRRVPEFSDTFDATCPTDNTTVTAPHNLGMIPQTVYIEGYQEGSTWRDLNDRRLTSDKSVTFHCEKAGKYTVTVGRK